MKLNIGGLCMQCGKEMLGTIGSQINGKYCLGFRCPKCDIIVEFYLENEDDDWNPTLS